MIDGASRGGRQRFTSQILPPSLRRSPQVSAVLPLLRSLHGLSTGDFREALPGLLGEDAAGLSPTAITRLTATWRTEYDEYDQWCRRSRADRDFISILSGWTGSLAIFGWTRIA